MNYGFVERKPPTSQQRETHNNALTRKDTSCYVCWTHLSTNIKLITLHWLYFGDNIELNLPEYTALWFAWSRKSGVKKMCFPGVPQPPTCSVQGECPYTGWGSPTIMDDSWGGLGAVVTGLGHEPPVHDRGTTTVTCRRCTRWFVAAWSTDEPRVKTS